MKVAALPRALAPALEAARSGAALLSARPRFALFLETPAGADPAAVQATLDSIEAQVYDGCDVHRANTAEARNAAMAASRADFVGAIRAGDRLSPVTLLRAAEAIVAGPDVDVLYTDEDVRLPDRAPARPRFKPDWSPELLHSCMYMGRLLLVRRTLAIQAGGYRAPMDGALDYDLALRACPEARRVLHVSDVLYHRGTSDPGLPDSASPAAAAALADASARAGLPADVAPGMMAGVWRARITVTDLPRIAIVIPTDGRGRGGAAPALVAACVRSLRQRTRYPHYELLVCDNGNLTADTRAYLDTIPHARVTYRWEGAFNFPRKINFAVGQTDAPFVLLLNDDVEPINDGWLDAMLEYAHQPQIGAVGAVCLSRRPAARRRGVGVSGVAAHHSISTRAARRVADRRERRNCSAVTAPACSRGGRYATRPAASTKRWRSTSTTWILPARAARRLPDRVHAARAAVSPQSATFGERDSAPKRWRDVGEVGPVLERGPLRQPDPRVSRLRIRSCK